MALGEAAGFAFSGTSAGADGERTGASKGLISFCFVFELPKTLKKKKKSPEGGVPEMRKADGEWPVPAARTVEGAGARLPRTVLVVLDAPRAAALACTALKPRRQPVAFNIRIHLFYVFTSVIFFEKINKKNNLLLTKNGVECA